MTALDQAILGELDKFADPVRRMADGPDGVAEVLGRLGWEFTSLAEDEIAAMAGTAGAILDAVEALTDATTDAADLAAILAILDAVRDLAVQVDDIAGALADFDLDPAPTLGELTGEVMGFLFARYLRTHRPAAYEIGRLLRLVDGPRESEAPEHVVLRGTTKTVRWPRQFERVRLDRLPALLTDPAGLLGEFYLDGGLAALRTADDVAQFVDRLWRPLSDLIFSLGGEPSRGVPTGVDLIATDEVMEYANSTLRLFYDFGALGTVGLRIVPIGEHLGGPRLIVTPFGTAAISRQLDGWTMYAYADTDSGPIVFWPDAVHLPPAAGAGVSGELVLLKNPNPDGVAFIVGAPTSSRLEIGSFGLGFGAQLLATGDYDWGPSLFVDGGRLVVDTGDADSFLAGLLGSGFEVDFDAHLRWTRKDGLRFDGSGGLTKRFVVDRSIGPITITGAELGITPTGDTVSLVAGADLAATLGPFAATVDGMGMALGLTFPETGGNLGPLDLSLGFAPPTRIGFAIESEAVHGGGFVAVEPPRYAGALSLDILAVGIDAVVVVDTALPGDPDGWALFASLSARFPGIPLGFGFTLLGAGGLLALNRTMDAEALASGLRSGVIDSLLFPDDPVGDSAQLIAQIDDYFPLMADNTVVGPVVMLGWGSPTLITAQLGVVLSLPDGVIAVMGSLEALLPVPEAPLLTLHMDSLGVVDVPAGTFALTASLYDSRLLETIDLGGDMAMYLCVAPQPYFLLSVGGYHPSFHPPSLVPAAMHDLRRMSASIVIADPISITIQSYFAITSNTVQFGASVNIEASVEVWPSTYTARGWFEFDVLLIFSPFKIVADLSAGVGIYSGNKELMGVEIAAHLEGPKPWYASALASFKFFGLKVNFDLEVGGKAPGEPKPIAHPRADALTALRSPASWQEAGPVDALAAGITYLTPDDDGSETVWVRPDHQLTARQSAAPLERTLEIVGQAVPAAGEEILHVTGAGIGAVAVDPVAAVDWFAPAQFEVLSQSEKLARASFEQMDAGVTFGLPDARITARPDELSTSVDTGYEEETYTVPEDDSLANSVGSGAAAIALRRAGAAPAPAFTIAATEYTLVRAADGAEATLALADSGVPAGGVSQYDALRARSLRIAGDPGARARMIVAPFSAALEPVPELEPFPGPILEPVA